MGRKKKVLDDYGFEIEVEAEEETADPTIEDVEFAPAYTFESLEVVTEETVEAAVEDVVETVAEEVVEVVDEVVEALEAPVEVVLAEPEPKPLVGEHKPVTGKVPTSGPVSMTNIGTSASGKPMTAQQMKMRRLRLERPHYMQKKI